MIASYENQENNVENQVKLQILVFNIPWGMGGEVNVRQVNSYSNLVCAQKREKCKFVPRPLSMIVDCVLCYENDSNVFFNDLGPYAKHDSNGNENVTKQKL